MTSAQIMIQCETQCETFERIIFRCDHLKREISGYKVLADKPIYYGVHHIELKNVKSVRELELDSLFKLMLETLENGQLNSILYDPLRMFTWDIRLFLGREYVDCSELSKSMDSFLKDIDVAIETVKKKKEMYVKEKENEASKEMRREMIKVYFNGEEVKVF